MDIGGLDRRPLDWWMDWIDRPRSIQQSNKVAALEPCYKWILAGIRYPVDPRAGDSAQDSVF